MYSVRWRPKVFYTPPYEFSTVDFTIKYNPARRRRRCHARLHERTVVNSTCTSGSSIHAIAVG